MMANFNSTQAGLEKLFEERCDLPFAVDEANLMSNADRLSMQNFVFRMTQGTEKASYNAQDRRRYHFVYMSSSNRPLHSLVGSADADTAAAALQRLLPLAVPGTDLGVFNSLPPGFDTSGQLASHLARATRDQHGTALRTFLRHLVNARHTDEGKLHRKIEKLISEFNGRAGFSLTEAGESRASNAFGLLYAAGRFAQHKGVIPAAWDCLEACLEGFRNYQRQLPSHTPWMTRLATLIASPSLLDLRGLERMPKLSTAQFSEYVAVIRHGKKGSTELLVPSGKRDELFPDWEKIIRSREFALIGLGTAERQSVQRKVRRGADKQWFVGFRLPPELVPPLPHRA